jgi:2',3'-cyclic-nucleotide 2'-phosphodiesterase (5'-nucleotidase family)
LPGKAVLRKTVNKVLAQGADIVVLLRHAGKYGGGENTFDLVKDIPEIDLVVGAHTHRGDAGSMVGNAWYVQPPAHGKALAKIKIVYNCKLRKIKQIKSSFVELETPGDHSVAVSGKAPSWQGESLDYPAEVIRKKYNADLALYAVNLPAKLQELLNDPSPELTDFYQVFPYFDSMITVVVTGGEFIAILREYAKFARKRKQYLAKSGFSADIVRGKVRHISSIERKKSYTLALSAYAAAGAGGNLMETRRILKDKIDYRQLKENMSLLEVLTNLRSVPQECLK